MPAASLALLHTHTLGTFWARCSASGRARAAPRAAPRAAAAVAAADIAAEAARCSIPPEKLALLARACARAPRRWRWGRALCRGAAEVAVTAAARGQRRRNWGRQSARRRALSCRARPRRRAASRHVAQRRTFRAASSLSAPPRLRSAPPRAWQPPWPPPSPTLRSTRPPRQSQRGPIALHPHSCRSSSAPPRRRRRAQPRSPSA